jgi:hypothetical protein
MILAGELPYRDIWDNKPPGLYYAYAAALAWFPSHALDCSWPLLPAIPDNVRVSCGQAGVSALDALWALGITLGVYASGRLMLGRPLYGVVGAALFLVFGVQSPVSHGGAKPELLLLLPQTMAYLLVWLYWRSGNATWAALSGACIALALLAKQTALAAAATTLVLLLFGHLRGSSKLPTPWAAVAAWAAGNLAVLLPVAMLFWSAGALTEMLYAVLGFNLEYARSPSDSVLARAIFGSWHVFRGSQALLWILALVGAASLVANRWRPRWAPLLVTWAIADAASLFLGGGRFYAYYYLQIVPSFSLLAASAIVRVWQSAVMADRERGRGLAFAHRAWLALSFAAVFSLSLSTHVPVLLRALHERALHWVPGEAEVAAAAIRRLPDGPLLVWGDANQLYVLTDRPPASRFAPGVAVSQRWAHSNATERRRDELMEEITVHPPSVIAIDPWTKREDPDGQLLLNLSSFDALRDLLRKGYRTAPADTSTFDVYVRSTGPDTPESR